MARDNRRFRMQRLQAWVLALKRPSICWTRRAERTAPWIARCPWVRAHSSAASPGIRDVVGRDPVDSASSAMQPVGSSIRTP
jgi:hypothetical protein